MVRQMKGLLGEQDHLLTLWVPSHQHHGDGLYYCSYVTAYECSQRGLDISHRVKKARANTWWRGV